MRLYFKINPHIFFILCCIIAFKAKAESSIVLPWLSLDIDTDEKIKLNRNLKNGRGLFVKEAGWTSIDAKQNKIPNLNLNGIAKDIVVKQSSERIYIQPAICPLLDQVIVFTEVVDKNLTMTGLGHTVLAKNTIDDNKISQALTQAFARSESNKNAFNSKARNSALQIQLVRGSMLTRKDFGSDRCLNLLLGEKLLGLGYKILPVIALENIAMVERILPNPNKKSRATRSISLKWLPRKNNPLAFPYELNLIRSHISGVFADPIFLDKAKKVAFKQTEDRIEFELDEGFLKQIEDESLALANDAASKIAKIDRGWAYLDKGRGWGLKMNDRLVAKSSPDKIKGHVVAFFGPEANVKSENGLIINEGAIVFIRKGQRQTKIGQELDFDSRRFPTPWPLK